MSQQIDQNEVHDHQLLVSELRHFQSFNELKSSSAYQKWLPRLKEVLNTPIVIESTTAVPRLSSFLRIVQWNIERGTRLEAIVDVLNNHPVLRYADLLLLNELDQGMIRSRNLNIARELGNALKAHVVYGVEYLEFTKGVGDELNLPSENSAALHGNAILSRYPLLNPAIIRLSRCENNFESKEKRLGGRIGVLAEVSIGGRAFLAATTHLDVVNSPACRARQLGSLLKSLQSYDGSILIGGDLNTHTFTRTNQLRAFRNLVRILRTDRKRLAQELMEAPKREPALKELLRFGFDFNGLNDGQATGRHFLSTSSLPAVRIVPGFLKRWTSRRMGPSGIEMEFRLDWFAGRSISPLRSGERKDASTGVESIEPQTVPDLASGESRISDHDPIILDITFPETGGDSGLERIT